MRFLTLSGKITILKTLVMSKIVFISFLSDVPKIIIDKLIKIQKYFLWDGKRPKIKHNTLIGSYEHGGLKGLDIELKIKALQLSWVRRLYDGSAHAWKNIPLFYIKKHSDTIFYPNLSITPNDNMPSFYKNIIKHWGDLSKCNPVTINSIAAQRLRYNNHLKIGNNAISWSFAGVNCVNDLLDDNGEFMDWQSFKTKYNLNNDNFFK
jgi:hypothetical protein